MQNFEEIACCLAMYNDLQDEYFFYDPTMNCIRYTTTNMEPSDRQVMAYCPHCGAKLPNYHNEFFEALEATIGPDGDHDNLPEEFKSDKWWRNRKIKGLGSFWLEYAPLKMSLIGSE